MDCSNYYWSELLTGFGYNKFEKNVMPLSAYYLQHFFNNFKANELQGSSLR